MNIHCYKCLHVNGYPSRNNKIFMRKMARVTKALLFVLFSVLYNATELVTGGDLDFSSRKLLTSEGDAEVKHEGIQECDVRDIDVFQAQETQVGGIPGFLVHISNECIGNCTKYDVHLSCGWFSSTKLVNPDVFKRIGYNDCLVKGGKDLMSGVLVSFRYYNSFRYPLKVSSFKCI